MAESPTYVAMVCMTVSLKIAASWLGGIERGVGAIVTFIGLSIHAGAYRECIKMISLERACHIYIRYMPVIAYLKVMKFSEPQCEALIMHDKVA